MTSMNGYVFTWENILAALTQIGICDAAAISGDFRGGQCHIFRVDFESAPSVALRLPLYMDARDAKMETLRTELLTLQMLEAKGFPWSPRCHAESLTFDNAIKHPFIVLTWFHGVSLTWNERFPPQAIRDKLLVQIAAIQLTLVECTMVKGPTATAFFRRLAENRRRKVEAGQMTGLAPQDCIDQLAFLDSALGADGEDTASAMDHGDLQLQNIIVDTEYNVQGLIDWAFAGFTPICRAAGLPRFLWPSSLSTPLDPIIQRDRDVYRASFATLSSPAALQMQHWQNASNVDFCTLLFESFFSRGMHLRLARSRWQVSSLRSLAITDKNDATQSHGICRIHAPNTISKIEEFLYMADPARADAARDIVTHSAEYEKLKDINMTPQP